jgi:hypothetical protein
MAAEFAGSAESIAKQTRQESGILRKRDHTVSYVSRREHLQFIPEPSRASAIIGDSDNRREAFQPGSLLIALADTLFESGEQRRETRPAADGDEFQFVIRFHSRQNVRIPFEKCWPFGHNGNHIRKQ